jgi:hypothetical protein
MEFTQINHSTKIFDELHARFDFFVDKITLVPQDEFFIVAKLLVQLNNSTSWNHVIFIKKLHKKSSTPVKH